MLGRFEHLPRASVQQFRPKRELETAVFRSLRLFIINLFTRGMAPEYPKEYDARVETIISKLRHELPLSKIDVKEGANPRFGFVFAGQYVWIAVNNEPDGPMTWCSVYDSKEQFLENPSFGKHPILSDLHFKGDVGGALDQIIGLLKRLKR